MCNIIRPVYYLSLNIALFVILFVYDRVVFVIVYCKTYYIVPLVGRWLPINKVFKEYLKLLNRLYDMINNWGHRLLILIRSSIHEFAFETLCWQLIIKYIVHAMQLSYRENRIFIIKQMGNLMQNNAIIFPHEMSCRQERSKKEDTAHFNRRRHIS